MAGLESSGIHGQWLCPCAAWVMGWRWLPWLLQTRQGCGCGGSGETCLPLAAMCGLCLACIWLQWACMSCPGRSWWGRLCAGQQDAMVLCAPCPRHLRLVQEPRNVLPMVLFQGLAPDCKSRAHEVLRDIQFCRLAPACLAPQSPRGSSLRPTCFTQVTAIALSRNKAGANASSVPSFWAVAASHTATGFSAEADMFWES